MTAKLIEVPRTAANWIESNKIKYDWDSPDYCNCGVVVNIEPNKHISTPISFGFRGEYHWNKRVEYCYTTGMPIPEVIQTLLKLSITAEDILNLE
jgi:hypothetical protein